jgi:hypothetical protein
VAAPARDGRGGAGGISIVLLGGIGTALAAAGAALVLLHRRRHAIMETPATG